MHVLLPCGLLRVVVCTYISPAIVAGHMLTANRRAVPSCLPLDQEVCLFFFFPLPSFLLTNS